MKKIIQVVLFGALLSVYPIAFVSGVYLFFFFNLIDFGVWAFADNKEFKLNTDAKYLVFYPYYLWNRI